MSRNPEPGFDTRSALDERRHADRRTIRAVVRAVTPAARHVSIYSLASVDGSELPAYEPGAHIGLLLPNGMERQYSLLQPFEDAVDRYVICVKHLPNGRGGSHYLHSTLRAGTQLSIRPPVNLFPMATQAAHSVFIAGGIGITPILCMFRALARSGGSRELHYAVHHSAEAAFRAEVQSCGAAARCYVSDEGKERLDIQKVIEAAPPQAHLYCCGPDSMIDAFLRACAGRPDQQVHVESFTAKAVDSESPGFTVRLARSNREFEIPAGTTILDVLHREGIDAVSSCRQGVCGACETRVIEGVPVHMDMILDDEEKKSHRTMMICCSRSASGLLVLDL